MEIKAGVIGGTLLVIMLRINYYEMSSTAILAAIGAVVSFSVSHLLKYIFKYIRHKK